MRSNLLLVFIVNLGAVLGNYEVPAALVEVFKPQGLRVSIPDEEGIKLFAFHAKVNEEMNGREGGTFSRDILKAKNGRWTFFDPNAKLKVGDVLYYWTYVDYFDGRNKLGYANDDNQFVVKELKNKDQVIVLPKPVTNNCVSTVNNQIKCSGEEIFKDDFNNHNKNAWTPEVKFAGTPDYEFVLYQNDERNIAIENGILKIRPIPTDELYGKGYVLKQQEVNLGVNCTGVRGSSDCVQVIEGAFIHPPVTSGQISTKNKFSFKYGKIEIRAKLPKGDWLYPELYLNPANEQYGPEYASGQIRIAFSPGNSDSSKLYGGCILGKTEAARNYALKTTHKVDGTWCDGYHTFTLIWRPNQITVSVDDTVYGQIFAPEGGFVAQAQNLGLKNVERWASGTSFAPFDQEMYITLGVGAGGFCFDDTYNSKPWKNYERKSLKKFYFASSQWRPSWTDYSALEVDYVKVSAL